MTAGCQELHVPLQALYTSAGLTSICTTVKGITFQQQQQQQQQLPAPGAPMALFDAAVISSCVSPMHQLSSPPGLQPPTPQATAAQPFTGKPLNMCGSAQQQQQRHHGRRRRMLEDLPPQGFADSTIFFAGVSPIATVEALVSVFEQFGQTIRLNVFR
jgi:hypothetical protein